MNEQPPCPHPGDPTHAGLGRAWCDAGREGQQYLAEREKRIAATRAWFAADRQEQK